MSRQTNVLRKYRRFAWSSWRYSRRLWLKTWLRYRRDYLTLGQMQARDTSFRLTPSYPCFTGNVDSSGDFGPYPYQDSWAFKHVLDRGPERLVDIGSSVYFIAFAAQVTRVISVDIRPVRTSIPTIDGRCGDITALPFDDESLDALSSLSVIEHVGLGRYGDTLDINGMYKAATELARVLKKSGMLLVAFPVGSENLIEFNAHRICTPETALMLFETLTLVDEKYATEQQVMDRDTFDEMDRPYAYGCYCFSK